MITLADNNNPNPRQQTENKMNIIVAEIKNLRTLVANSDNLKHGLESGKDPRVVAGWIMNSELSYLKAQILTGGDELAQEILAVVRPIYKEANKLGYEMKGLPASTVYQGRALWAVAGTIRSLCKAALDY